MKKRFSLLLFTSPVILKIMTAFSVFLAGFVFYISIIVTIGLQNAFVLRQGLKKRHVFFSCFTTAICDVILITAGLLGFGLLLEKFPNVMDIVRLGGAVFLFIYGAMSFYNSLKPEALNQESAKGLVNEGGLHKTILVAAGVSLLNPHAILDATFLVGSVASSHEGAGRYLFSFGAMFAAFVWMFSLGYGARFLAPIFEKPRAWQILDILMGIIMWVIGYTLIREML